MSYLQIEQLSKSFGDKTLFTNIDFGISRGQKAALIAKNGAGKSTLLNIINDLLPPDTGKVIFQKNIKVSYLEQNPEFHSKNSVGESILLSDNKMMTVVRKYREFMQENPDMNNEETRNKYQKLVEKMDSNNAWDYEAKIKQIITRLRIESLTKPLEELSGGQKKRVALAKLLIDEPDFLILDEPTNHLDVDIIEWLENFFAKSGMTILMVTHDRYFIDKICNLIFELDNQQLYTYRGNYNYFLTKKKERINAEVTQNEKARNLLKKETEWMKHQPKARTTKSKTRINQYYQLKGKAENIKENDQVEISMQMSRMGKKVLELNDISKKYDTTTVINNFSYIFKKNERVGIIGPNGSGKSTLLNIITNKIKPDTGNVAPGETITFGYYTQEGMKKPADDKKVIEVITDISENIIINNKDLSASQFLNYFNFPYNAQYDYVNKLSGGEKRRLYLMTILIKKPNFLILDEPTNDLDIQTLNVLEDFLENFPGCLIIVSHDRFFLDKLVDHLFVFDNNTGNIKDFPGNYTEYSLNNKNHERTQKREKKSSTKKAPVKNKKSKNKLTYKEKKELELLDKEIPKLETQKKQLLEKMNSGEITGNELIELSEKYQQYEDLLEQKTDRWVELSEKN